MQEVWLALAQIVANGAQVAPPQPSLKTESPSSRPHTHAAAMSYCARDDAGTIMATPNYSFAKKQRELAKKQKKDAKQQRKQSTPGESGYESEGNAKADSDKSPT